MTWPVLFVVFNCCLQLPAPAAAIASLLFIKATAGPRTVRGPGVPKPNPFDGVVDSKFKRRYRFYPADVKRLARALRLPPVIRLSSRHKMSRDSALLMLLAKYVRGGIHESTTY